MLYTRKEKQMLYIDDGELFLLRKKVWRMTQLRFLIKLELVNTMPEVYLSAHANTLSKLHVKFKLGCILTDLSTGVGP